MSHLGRTLEERFWSKVDFSGECWIWVAGKNEKGYGRITRDAKSVLAHRLSYELAKGVVVPSGMMVCHNCPGGDNPACVNPDHLFLGTNTDNVRDMIKKGRAPFQSQTHCTNGHERTLDNTFPSKGGRECRICANDTKKRFRERNPDKPRPKRTLEQLTQESAGKRRRRAEKKMPL